MCIIYVLSNQFIITLSISKSCNKPIYQHEIQLVHNNKTLRITSSIVGTTKNQSDVIRTWRYGL